jgi:hypothetical protein
MNLKQPKFEKGDLVRVLPIKIGHLENIIPISKGGSGVITSVSRIKIYPQRREEIAYKVLVEGDIHFCCEKRLERR